MTRIGFVLAMLLLGSPTWGASADQDLHSLLENIHSMRGKFEQRLSDGDKKLIQQSQGSFELKRPGFLSWHVAPPYEQVIVSNGSVTWVYDPDLEQATRYLADQNQGPMQIINGTVKTLSDNYQVSEKSKGKKKFFSLLPTHPQTGDGSFSELEFVFSGEHLQSIRMIDKLDQTTQIDFKSVKVNEKIADEDFVFKVPDGVDIIDNAKQ